MLPRLLPADDYPLTARLQQQSHPRLACCRSDIYVCYSTTRVLTAYAYNSCQQEDIVDDHGL